MTRIRRRIFGPENVHTGDDFERFELNLVPVVCSRNLISDSCLASNVTSDNLFQRYRQSSVKESY